MGEETTEEGPRISTETGLATSVEAPKGRETEDSDIQETAGQAEAGISKPISLKKFIKSSFPGKSGSFLGYNVISKNIISSMYIQ